MWNYQKADPKPIIRLGKISQIFPISLLTFYITLFFLTNLDSYYDWFNNFIIQIDTIFFILSFASCVLFIHYWEKLARVSFITVIVLNILTELSFRIDIEYYYEIYEWVIKVFFAIMILFSITKQRT